MIELNRIYNEDCLEGMKRIPDKSIDLIITDPPYGKKADKGTNGFGTAKSRRYAGGWDSEIPQKEIFDEMFRVSKNLIIFGGNYFSHMLPPSKCWIFWDKKGDIAFQNPFADGELIYTTFKKPLKKIVFKQQGFITDSKDKRYHPTQKPSELVQILINEFAQENATILDPFMGSGTTAIACINTNRNYIGFELDKHYCDIANERIQKILDASIFESGVKYAVEVAGEIKHYKQEDLISFIPDGETKKRVAKNHTLWALKVAMPQVCRCADEMEKQKSYLTAGMSQTLSWTGGCCEEYRILHKR